VSVAKLSSSDVRFTKVVVFVNALVPLAMLVWDTARDALGANPLEYLLQTTGMLALVFVTLSLAVTPLRRVSGIQWLAVHRRALGLFAFFYAVLHLIAYSWFDKALDLGAIVADTIDRPFILAGMGAFLLMAPLAATSTNGMIKRIGAKRWKQLHKAAYAAGALGVLHYFLLVKADTRLPLAFAAVLALLLGARAVAFVRDRRRKAGTAPASGR
jgi:sulfoxide reductase heme-binding subunit YedZ